MFRTNKCKNIETLLPLHLNKIVYLFWHCESTCFDIMKVHVLILWKYMFWHYESTCFDIVKVHVLTLWKYMFWHYESTCFDIMKVHVLRYERTCFDTLKVHFLILWKYMFWHYESTCFNIIKVNVLTLWEYIMFFSIRLSTRYRWTRLMLGIFSKQNGKFLQLLTSKSPQPACRFN